MTVLATIHPLNSQQAGHSLRPVLADRMLRTFA